MVFTFHGFEGSMSRMGIRAFQREVELFRQHGGGLRMSEALRLGVSRRTLYAMRDAGMTSPSP